MWNISKVNGVQLSKTPSSTFIAENMIADILDDQSHFRDFVQNDDNLHFNFHSVKYNEVRDTNISLKNSKTKDPFEINVKIMETSNRVLVYTLSKLKIRVLKMMYSPRLL